MATSVVRRPARTPAPVAPGGEVKITSPPTGLRRASGSGAMQLIMPLLGSGGGMVMMLANPQPLFILGGCIMAGGSVVMGASMVLQGRSAGHRAAAATRRRYLAHLGDARHDLEAADRAQRAAAAWRHPSPDRLWAVARDVRRLWERRPDDGDFLTLRVGTGRVPMTRRPTLDDGSGSLQEPDPICAAAAGRLVRRWTSADGQPLTVDLRGAASIAVRGPRDASLALVRAMLAQAAAWHAPDDLLIAVAASGPRLDEWEWCKWLPHAQDVDLADETGPGRLLGRTFEEFERAAHQEVSARHGSRSDGRNPHLLVVVDGLTGDPRLGGMLAGAPAGVTAVHVVERPHEEPGEVTGRVILDGGGGITVATAALSLEGRADRLAAGPAEALARLLAPLRLSAGSAGRALGRTVEVTDLLGLGDVAALDPAVSWRPRSVGDFLNVPFGVGPLGEPVRLDLKESALGGHGPHGLLIGATGSGKSELLRTLLVALAATHPPELLAMVLADFKGGAAFAGLSGLPHVAGIITNLSAEVGLVERMRAALIGEQQRRQEMLAAAGNLANIREYQALRARGRTDLEPLPNLLVVIDEFSELIAQHPDFVDVFVGIGRLGRSLGVHLLFSSQRLEEGRLRGLDSHLSYRLGLRTFSALDSRSVLGVPDAYELPPVPGSGYLKVDTSVWQRFKAALVSGPYRAPHEVAEDRRPKPVAFAAVTTEEAGGADSAVRPEDSTGPSVLDVIVDRLRDGAPRVHQVWVSPLPASVGLGSLLGPVEAHPVRGLVAVDWPGIGRLQVALGLVDRPVEQRTDILVHDFSGAAGQLAVVGGPQSGKSTLLRTLVGSLALSHAPTEVQVYGVDLGGGGLRALAGLPHVGTVADRLEPELARRVVGEVHGQLRRREELFRRLRIDSVADLRTRRSAGELADEPYGDVFLVIDGWDAFRQAFEDLEPAVIELASRGLGYGLHVVITANRWLELRPALKDAIGGRLELRLNDPLESDVDRKVAQRLAAAGPGRGLTRDRLMVQIAVPRIDGDDGAATLAAGLGDLVDAARRCCPYEGAPCVELLPQVVRPEALAGAGSGAGVPVGLSEVDLRPVVVELGGTEPHLVVVGDGQSGKTSFLRAYVQGLCARLSPDRCRVLVVDYRRTLLEAVPSTHLRGYAGAGPAAQSALGRLSTELEARLPGADLTVAELRSRSWWSGPEIYVVVDDYDLVVTPSGNPLSPLMELLPQARDVGLHLLLARRSGGVSRGLFEPVFQRVRELGCVHLLLSGDPNEGVITGNHRLTRQPPGRGLLVRRSGALLVQTVLAEAGAEVG